ncbi:MAG: SHOCT domain-containing protein [Candidatus Hydrothermarchaeota archaeon]
MSEERLRLIEKRLSENEKKLTELDKLFKNGEITEDEYTAHLYTLEKNKESLKDMVEILKKDMTDK